MKDHARCPFLCILDCKRRPARICVIGDKMSLNRNNKMPQNLSYISGPTDNPLWTVTLGALAEIQAEIHGDRTALVFPWQNERKTYRELFQRSNTIAKSLLESGLQYGDCVGIFAGNCVSYLEVFLGASFIGCPVVVLNSNYTPPELEFTVGYSGKYSMRNCSRSRC